MRVYLLALAMSAVMVSGVPQKSSGSGGGGSVERAVVKTQDKGAGAQPGTDSGRELLIELTIPASRTEVWKAFSTSEGLSTWLAPGAVVDLREGGDWMVRFPGGSSAGGTILSFVPEKEIVISALAPEKFPHVRADRIKARFSFETRGDSTVVRLTQTGWKTGSEWDEAYEYLAQGNAQLLATLHRRFVSGPIDWGKLMGGDKPVK
jgi:uncharacterized protein YndB with AHSA1/START domain